MRGLGQAGGGEETLHGVLVHGGGGAENARADVGDVGQLEEALDGSVLAEGAVQHGEDDVERGGERVAGLRKIGPGAAFEAVGGAPHRGGAGIWSGSPQRRTAAAVANSASASLAALEQRRRGAASSRRWASVAAEPAALLVDGDGDDLVLLAVDGLEDGGGREQRDFVLAGAAAKENANAEFLLHADVERAGARSV